MNAIVILFVVLLLVVVFIVGVIIGASIPDICPRCGSRMRFESWINEDDEEVSAQVCPKCEHEIILNVE